MDGSKKNQEPLEVKAVSPDEARAKLAEGLLPEESKVIINTSRAAGPFEQVMAFEASRADLSGDAVTQRRPSVRRIRSREILVSVGLVGALSLLVWWQFFLRAQSNAQQNLADPGLVTAIPAGTHEWVDDGVQSPEVSKNSPAVEVRVPPAKPAGRSRRSSEPAPSKPSSLPAKQSARPKSAAPGNAPAPGPAAVDPEAKEWLNATVDRK